MYAGTITIEVTRPALRARLSWYLLQLRLRAAQPFTARMTTDEWYAADCPAYPGQRAPWKFPKAANRG